MSLKYEKHLFVCTNQRTEGTRPSCGEQNGLALVAAFKKAIKDKNIDYPIRAQRAGCFDFCEHGPMVVVYPEGVFYKGVQLDDVNEIVESHLINRQVVERLRF